MLLHFLLSFFFPIFCPLYLCRGRTSAGERRKRLKFHLGAGDWGSETRNRERSWPRGDTKKIQSNSRSSAITARNLHSCRHSALIQFPPPPSSATAPPFRAPPSCLTHLPFPHGLSLSLSLLDFMLPPTTGAQLQRGYHGSYSRLIIRTFLRPSPSPADFAKQTL